jgi:hypothetical protein
MYNVQEYYLKSGLLDRQRKFVICEDYIEFETGDLKGNEFTRFNCNDIVDFKHGVDWLIWYKSSVGRIYSITFKNKNNQELRVTFANYFGFFRSAQQKANIQNRIHNSSRLKFPKKDSLYCLSRCSFSELVDSEHLSAALVSQLFALALDSPVTHFSLENR